MDSAALVKWYEENHRELPWREVRDPYRIWISEIILQQTRVAQGLDYYLRFIERFPDISALATASEDEVLLYWQGLGYYSRARNLHAAAKQVMADYDGIFPVDYHELRKLKGIGEYTAAAVSSFSADAPFAVVDGNVYRVLSRLFDIRTPIDSTRGKKEFAGLAQELMDQYLASDETNHSGIYNQAIMELGALLCGAKLLNCSICPVSNSCLALQNGTAERRPVKAGKTAQRVRYFHYLHITDPENNTLLNRREGKDIWQGLFEFPLIETTDPAEFDEIRNGDEFRRIINRHGYTYNKSITMPKHILSHQIIHAVFHRITLVDILSTHRYYQTVRKEDIGRYAISRLTDLYLSR